MKSASVLIVGGGIVGASIAWHLAERGWRDVAIVDRAGGPGGGSTGRTEGGFRTLFTSAPRVKLSLLSREKLLRFRDETGSDPGYEPVGYLWVAGGDEELQVLREALRVQRAAGALDARELSADEVSRLNPALAPDGIAGGLLAPADGFIQPMAMLGGYLSAAERRGVRVLWGTELQSFRRDGMRRITSAVTSAGTMRVGAVVNAAGPWAGPLADKAGVALPVLPLRRQAFGAPAEARLPAGMPVTVYAADGFQVRSRGGQVLVQRPSPGIRGRPWDCSVDPEWLKEVAELARQRVPALAETSFSMENAWGGLHEISPDHHVILGAATECPNFYLANGASGHGVTHAPAMGQLLAELMSDGETPALDLTPFRLSRFSEGRPNPPPGLA